MPSKQVTFQGILTWDGPLTPDNSLPGGGGGVVSPPIYYPPYPSWGPGFPTNPIAPGGPPPVAGWPGVGAPIFPSNPIAPGGTTPPWGIQLPPSIWPSPGRPDNSLPGLPPTIWPSPGYPSHPIFLPPGIWGPNDPRPGTGLPGEQPPSPVVPPNPDEDKVYVLKYNPKFGWMVVELPPDSGGTPSEPTPEPKPEDKGRPGGPR